MAEGLGWLTPVPGSIVANQLAELGRMHPSSEAAEETTSQLLAGAVPRCLLLLRVARPASPSLCAPRCFQ